MANGDTKTESYLRVAAEGTRADLPTDTCCNTKTQNLILGVANRIMDVEDEVEELKNNPDVVDIVDTYADLQAYDTSTLTDKDIIRVLEDSTHNNNSTFYRWNATTNQFDYIGEVSGGGGVTPVQTTGTSTTDVMSQDATTKLIYPDIANYPYKMGIGESTILGTNKALAINGIINSGINGGSIAIGATDGSQAQIGQNGRADQSVAIGNAAGIGRGMHSVAIGAQAFANSGQDNGDNVALGHNTNAGVASATNAVALGAYAQASRTGEVNIGTGSNGSGYNSTNYRVLGGVHDGQLAQDAVTVNQVNATIDAINTALSTNIPHIGS